jgi:hypothetical protein
VLQLRLADIDATKPTLPPGDMKFADEEKVTVSGINPRQFSSLMMEMIVALDAVETLPELLRIETQYHNLIVAAQAEPKFKLPVLQLDGCFTEPASKHSLTKRDKEILPFQLMQRQILSIISRLLRRQQFQPLLETGFEKTYATAIKARAQQQDLRSVKTLEDAKAQEKTWVRFDPVYNIPLGYIEDYPAVEFNAKLREQIRGIAEEFVKTVPRDQWKVNAD